MWVTSNLDSTSSPDVHFLILVVIIKTYLLHIQTLLFIR